MEDYIKILETVADSQLVNVILALSVSFVLSNRNVKSIVQKNSSISDQMITEKLGMMELEIIRLQLMTGMTSRSLNLSEISQLLDRYKSLGGNSFVSYRAKEYIKELEEEV